MFLVPAVHAGLVHKFRLTMRKFHAALAVVTSNFPPYEAHILTRASNFVLLQPYQG